MKKTSFFYIVEHTKFLQASPFYIKILLKKKKIKNKVSSFYNVCLRRNILPFNIFYFLTNNFNVHEKRSSA